MKKLFLIALLSVASFGQNFDAQAAAAHADIANLQLAAEAKVAADAVQIAADAATQTSLNQQIAALTATNTQLAATIQQLQSTATYRDLEWGVWSINDSVNVGGSGNGVAAFTPADTNKPAVFSVAPAAVTTGTNYYDAYATQKKKPNARYKNFYLAARWDFPSDADMNAAHCIEMEMRQVFGGMAAVPALQMNFDGNQLRYFDKAHGWLATGSPMPRSRSITAILEAHRDDAFVYYDAISINGTRYPLAFQEAIFPLAWADRMSVSVQLDARGLAFKVNPSAMVFSAW